MAWLCSKCSTSVLEELIAYEILHGVMWLGGEDQETWLGYNGPGCYWEGQVRGSGAVNHVAVKLEKGLGVDGPSATLKSKRSSNRWTNKTTWWHEVDHITYEVSIRPLKTCVNCKWHHGGWMLMWHHWRMRWNGMCKAKVYVYGISFHWSKVEERGAWQGLE